MRFWKILVPKVSEVCLTQGRSSTSLVWLRPAGKAFLDKLAFWAWQYCQDWWNWFFHHHKHRWRCSCPTIGYGIMAFRRFYLHCRKCYSMVVRRSSDGKLPASENMLLDSHNNDEAPSVVPAFTGLRPMGIKWSWLGHAEISKRCHSYQGYLQSIATEAMHHHWHYAGGCQLFNQSRRRCYEQLPHAVPGWYLGIDIASLKTEITALVVRLSGRTVSRATERLLTCTQWNWSLWMNPARNNSTKVMKAVKAIFAEIDDWYWFIFW